MKEDRVPGNARTYLTGVLATLTMVALCALLGAAVILGAPQPHHALVIVGTPDIRPVPSDAAADSESQEQDVRFSFDLENRARDVRLNQAGRFVTARTCFISIGDGAGGSGFLLNHDLLVTAYHVIDDVETETVDVYCAKNGVGQTEMRRARILVVEPAYDTAFLRLEGVLPDNAPQLRLAVEQPDLLVPLHMFGFERADEDDDASFVGRHRATSLVAQARLHGDDCPEQDLVILAGLAEQGNSGGPVFQEDGSVIGMIIIVMMSRNVTLVVPAFTIQSLLVLNGLVPEPENE